MEEGVEGLVGSDAFVAAMFGLGSCANQDGPETGNGTKGESTYASFKVSVASNSTRAEGEDGLDEEQRIAQMQLYVFAEGILEAHETVTLDENGKTTPHQDNDRREDYLRHSVADHRRV